MNNDTMRIAQRIARCDNLRRYVFFRSWKFSEQPITRHLNILTKIEDAETNALNLALTKELEIERGIKLSCTLNFNYCGTMLKYEPDELSSGIVEFVETGKADTLPARKFGMTGRKLSTMPFINIAAHGYGTNIKEYVRVGLNARSTLQSVAYDARSNALQICLKNGIDELDDIGLTLDDTPKTIRARCIALKFERKEQAEKYGIDIFNLNVSECLFIPQINETTGGEWWNATAQEIVRWAVKSGACIIEALQNGYYDVSHILTNQAGDVLGISKTGVIDSEYCYCDRSNTPYANSDSLKRELREAHAMHTLII